MFISIGDEEKLKIFLDSAPSVSRDDAFVDSYDRGTYKSVGLGLFTEADKEKAKAVKLKAPELGGFGGWLKYLKNSVALAPIEKGKPGIPEGVLQLGGTFVVKGNEVVFRYDDVVPGDTPDLAVLETAILDALS